MRIRRRPQAQAPIPSPLLRPASDPSTAPSQPPPPPSPQPHWLSQEEEEEVEVDAGEKSKSGELHRPNADLGDEPSRSRQAQPQGNNVVEGRSSSSQNTQAGGGGAQGAQDGQRSIENGHRDWPLIGAGEERLVNGSMPVTPPTAAVHGKEGIKSDGPKRRRSPAVLLEGSRCSRVNGRGWRCSQPTLAGYSLCEHHLGKGRLQSRRATNGGDGGGGRSAGGTKVGRTKPASSRKSAAAMALVTVTAAPMPPTEPANAAAHLRSIHGTVQ